METTCNRCSADFIGVLVANTPEAVEEALASATDRGFIEWTFKRLWSIEAPVLADGKWGGLGYVTLDKALFNLELMDKRFPEARFLIDSYRTVLTLADYDVLQRLLYGKYDVSSVKAVIQPEPEVDVLTKRKKRV